MSNQNTEVVSVNDFIVGPIFIDPSKPIDEYIDEDGEIRKERYIPEEEIEAVNEVTELLGEIKLEEGKQVKKKKKQKIHIMTDDDRLKIDEIFSDERSVFFIGKTLRLSGHSIQGSLFKNSHSIRRWGVTVCMQKYMTKLFKILENEDNQEAFLAMKGARLAMFPSNFNHGEVIAFILDNDIPFDEAGKQEVETYFSNQYQAAEADIIASLDSSRLNTKRGSYPKKELERYLALLSIQLTKEMKDKRLLARMLKEQVGN